MQCPRTACPCAPNTLAISLEADAHAQPDLKNLDLRAGEDTGAERNVDSPADHREDSMTADYRVVHTPLFFPLREVHTVPSVWLSLNRVTRSHAGTVRDVQVLEPEEHVWRYRPIPHESPVHRHSTYLIHIGAPCGAIHGDFLPLMVFYFTFRVIGSQTTAHVLHL